MKNIDLTPPICPSLVLAGSKIDFFDPKLAKSHVWDEKMVIFKAPIWPVRLMCRPPQRVFHLAAKPIFFRIFLPSTRHMFLAQFELGKTLVQIRKSFEVIKVPKMVERSSHHGQK